MSYTQWSQPLLAIDLAPWGICSTNADSVTYRLQSQAQDRAPTQDRARARAKAQDRAQDTAKARVSGEAPSD